MIIPPSGHAAQPTPAPPSVPSPAAVAAAAAVRSAHSHPAIGSAVQQLDAVVGLDLDAHPDALARVHAELQRALADLDNA